MEFQVLGHMKNPLTKFFAIEYDTNMLTNNNK